MDITELKIKNEVLEYGLTDDEILKLETAINRKQTFGTIYVLRKNDFVFGVKYNTYSESSIIREENADIKKFPCLTISNLKINFELAVEDIKKISTIKDSYTDYRDFESYAERNYNDMAQLKKMLKEIIVNNSLSSKEWVDDDVLTAVYWVFDDTYKEGSFDNVTMPNGFSRIVKIWEEDNNRYSLGISDYDNEKKFKLCKIEHTDECYNYIDENRLFSGKRYVWDDIEESELEVGFVNKISDAKTFMLISKEIYDRAVQKYKFKVQRENEDAQLSVKIKEEIEKKTNTLSETNPIILGGIKFTDKGIFYQGQEISGYFSPQDEDKVGWRNYRDYKLDGFYDFVKKCINDNGDTPDFNRMYDKFCEEMEHRTFTGMLGGVSVVVDAKTNRAGKHYTINGVRINQVDVVPLLKRAICFEQESEYYELLKKVSKCNLTFYDIISNGLIITIRQGDYNDTKTDLILKLEIIRKNGRNYLLFDEKEYRISNTNKLISYSLKAIANMNRKASPTFAEMIKIFKDMFKFDDAKIITLFKDGLKTYLVAVKKSEQFLADALNVCDASEIETDGKKGYLITGTSGQQYFLGTDTQIFKYPEMKYICIVDKTLGNGFNNDRLASRIYALKNDSKIANQVYTLNKNRNI